MKVLEVVCRVLPCILEAVEGGLWEGNVRFSSSIDRVVTKDLPLQAYTKIISTLQ
jgi:hypothetical protein